MRRPIGAIVIGAALAGLTAILVGAADPVSAQCAPGSLITFAGTVKLSEPTETPARVAWTFQIDEQPTGLTLPNPVVVVVSSDPPAAGIGDPLQVGARYRATVQLIIGSAGSPTYVADACGGGFQLLQGQAPTTRTSDPIFATSTRTTVSAQGEAQSAWKFLLGGVGIIAVVGGVLRTATGRRRN
jgi:hypothetical protein